MAAGQVIYKELSYQIVGSLFDVYNELGYGYKEKIYETAIAKCLQDKGLHYSVQVPCEIIFRGKAIGKRYLDFLIESKIVLEIKKGGYFSRRNLEQVKEYLKCTDKKLAILANFTESGVKFMRVLNIVPVKTTNIERRHTLKENS